MTSKSMSSIARNFAAIGTYCIGSNRFSLTTSRSDYNTIVAGLTLWYGVVLDYNSMFCAAEERTVNHGRIVNHTIDGWSAVESSLEDFLIFLDRLDDILMKHVASPGCFKGDLFLKEVQTWPVSTWLAPLKGCLLVMFRASLDPLRHGDETSAIRAVRQISCFLKKLDVDRPDLHEQMCESFLSFESELAHAVTVRSTSDQYHQDVSEMKRILMAHLECFSMDGLVPGHGPGAVADPDVKCWYDKYMHFSSDRRIGFLLDHAGLGREVDYAPFAGGACSTRTSRYITVPKTWKKLRGISAEPPELQFWQQGLMRRIDSMFRHDKWWSSRVDLHSQLRSRDLALRGSITGAFATVDLSSASDSVTLQLVRDLFGNTKLARWLLGTRSTHTLCAGQTIRIHKFAPMGSACCFPVECMVFALAAEVAVRRTRKPSDSIRQVCVYGDDIILPSYAVHELFSILSTLGFSTNVEKSFWEGEFREACGIEAWRGHDIAPCRFRRWHSGLRGHGSDYDEVASLLSFANELFDRGLHGTRQFLLESLYNKTVPLGGSQRCSVQKAVFATFSGECSTLISPQPTNFHLDQKFDRRLQTLVYRRLLWTRRLKGRGPTSGMSQSADVCLYIEWLVRHQAGVTDFDSLWSEGWLEGEILDPTFRLPLGTVMVPTLRWVPSPSEYHLR